MNPGLLNKRIAILEQIDTTNSYGETVDSWEDKMIISANIKPLQGRELFHAQQIHSEITTKITIRYRPNILSSMRIRYGQRILEIISPPINVNEQNRFLEILCKEVF